MYFYLHPHFKDYSSLFVTNLSNIKVLPFDNGDLQLLIKESAIFITDFSSLAFDFAYMRKPVIYYQYDEKEYFEKHYIKGYFDYRRDGFGPVCNTFESTKDTIKKYLNQSQKTDKQFIDNGDRFFVIRDNYNCQRIFDAIRKL